MNHPHVFRSPFPISNCVIANYFSSYFTVSFRHVLSWALCHPLADYAVALAQHILHAYQKERMVFSAGKWLKGNCVGRRQVHHERWIYHVLHRKSLNCYTYGCEGITSYDVRCDRVLSGSLSVRSFSFTLSLSTVFLSSFSFEDIFPADFRASQL